MKKIQYYISALLLVAVTAMSLTSCSEDDLGPTIFEDVDESLSPDSYTYQLDKFLKENFLDKYNLTFLYKMPDVSTQMDYNLVPASYEKSIDLAVLCKHLWFDVYDKVAGPDFLKQYGPRIILLVGSPAYNPSSGSETVGLAEGGIKISLFKVNAMRINDFDMMNENYFKTMHHEFAHILHQTKTYPAEFNTISVGHYDPNNWQDRSRGMVASLGFVTKYASSEFREDFAETIANYIVKTNDQWNEILDLARRGWKAADEESASSEYYCYYYYPDNDVNKDLKYAAMSEVEEVVDADGTVHKYMKGAKMKDPQGNRIVVYDVVDEDGIDGVEAINQKVQIAREWLKTAWNVDLDVLRQEVQSRQVDEYGRVAYDINELRKWVTEIQ